MQQHRIIVMLSVLVMLIIPVMGWFLVAQPQLAAASLADADRADAVAQIEASKRVVAQLKEDSAKLPDLERELNELRSAIPATVDPSGYIDGLSALAKISGVQINALSVDDPLAYSPAEAPQAAAPPASEGDSTATPSAPPAPVVEGLVTNPLVDASNFVAIPVDVEVSGKSASVMRFVHGLQSNDRLFLVTALSTEPAAAGALLGKVTGFIYAIPTGVAGNPHPVSTIVKSMDPPKPPVVETPTGTPTPTPTETAEP